MDVKDERVLSAIHYSLTKSGEELISLNEPRYRTKEEITQSLIDAGFSIDKVYGKLDWRLANEDNSELIFAAIRN